MSKVSPPAQRLLWPGPASGFALASALALAGLTGACQGELSSRPSGAQARASAQSVGTPEGLSAMGSSDAPESSPGGPAQEAEGASPPPANRGDAAASPPSSTASVAESDPGKGKSPAAGSEGKVSPQAEVPPPAPGDGEALACAEQGQAIYEQRIAPVLADDRPKSCNQCHLAGVDLGLFVRETPCETMACLQELELVDVADPQASTVLSWIGRAKPTSPLITAEVIAAEYDGFLEWIEHAAECGELECAGVTCNAGESDPFCEYEQEPQRAAGPDLDEGGCSELELERLFRNSVYASRGRCSPCHFSGNTRAAPGAARFIEQSGTCDQSSLVTMRNVIDSGLVSVEDPTESLLLRKPLAESAGGVPHGGHDKFFGEEDPAFVNFLHWLTRYADCAGGAL